MSYDITILRNINLDQRLSRAKFVLRSNRRFAESDRAFASPGEYLRKLKTVFLDPVLFLICYAICSALVIHK